LVFHSSTIAMMHGPINIKVPLYLDASIYVTGILYGSYFVSCNRSDLCETRIDVCRPYTPVPCSAICL